MPDRAADTAAVAAYREGFALSHYGLGSAVAVVLFLILLAFSLLYVRLIGKEGADMRWLLKRGWMYAAMIAISVFALFPIYWVVITSLKPRSEIYTRTPDLWPSDPAVGPVPARAGRGPRRPRADELADRRQRHDGHLRDRQRAGGLRAGPLPRAGHADPADPRADDADVPARRARDPAVRDDAQGGAAGHLLEPDHHLPGLQRAAGDLGHARVHPLDPGGARARGADRRRDALRRDSSGSSCRWPRPAWR